MAGVLNHCLICLKIGLHIKKFTIYLGKQDKGTKLNRKPGEKQQCSAVYVNC